MTFPGFSPEPAETIRPIEVPTPPVSAVYSDGAPESNAGNAYAAVRRLGRVSASTRYDDGPVALDTTLEISDVFGVLLVDLIATPVGKLSWAFSFDGHIFYVLDFDDRPALVCDLTTGQWHSWHTEGGPWIMSRGIMWQGRMIAADLIDAKVWEIDPHSLFDQETVPVRRAVTGFQPHRGSDSVRQSALRLTARKENDDERSAVHMRFSDDGGKTWSMVQTVVIPENAALRRIEYRSLGRVRAPGRLWELEDEGGLVRIDDADAGL